MSPLTTNRPAVFLTQTPYTPQIWGGDGLARRFREQYHSGTNKPFQIVERAEEADLIVYCEDYQESEQRLAPKLRKEKNVRHFPERVFIISSEDRPLGFLSGIYASMPRRRFDQNRFRAGGFFGDINPFIGKAEGERSTQRRWLFSFIGARTAQVRTSIFDQLCSSEQWLVQETENTEYSISIEDPAKAPGQQAYLRSILESHFVLCPRGFGTSSFRLFETMRLGRVPVILADEWVPSRGPAWQEFAIRIAEEEVPALPDILAGQKRNAEKMGALARREWELWFSAQAYPYRCLEWIHEIALSRLGSEREAFKNWSTLIEEANGPDGGL